MSQGVSFILIKLLSGANAGAEMELAPGDWMLGSDEDCQIMVLDAGIKPHHLLLHVEESGEVTLIPKNGAVLVDGKPLPPEGAVIAPFTIFTIGGTHAAYGPADETWPDLALPSLVQTPHTEAGADPNPALADAGRDNANEVGTTAARDADKVGTRPLGRVILLAALGLLLFGLVIDYTSFGIFFTDAGREAAALTRTLHRRGFPDVRAVVQQNGSLLVRGTVPSNARMDALVRYVEGLDPKPGLSLTSLEDIMLALQAKAKLADAPLRITRSGSALRVSGYVYDMLALENILLEEKDALATVPLRVDVTTWDRAEKELRSMLATRNLDSKTRLIPDLYRVILQSQPLSAPEQQALRVFLRETEDVFGVEGVITVERWRRAPKSVPRTPSPARVLVLRVNEAGSEPKPVQAVPQAASPEKAATTASPETPANPAASASPPETPGTPSPNMNTDSAPFALPSLQIATELPELPDLLVQQEFSCDHLRIVGQGHDMGVIRGGVLYKTGAKMPDNLQVKLITPEYVVLQRGSIHTRICTAAETAKESSP